MENYVLVSTETGEPVMDSRGLPVTFRDLLAEATAWAEADGYVLETRKNEKGEDMFRLVKRT